MTLLVGGEQRKWRVDPNPPAFSGEGPRDPTHCASLTNKKMLVGETGLYTLFTLSKVFYKLLDTATII